MSTAFTGRSRLYGCTSGTIREAEFAAPCAWPWADLSNGAPISLVRQRNCVRCRVQTGWQIKSAVRRNGGEALLSLCSADSFTEPCLFIELVQAESSPSPVVWLALFRQCVCGALFEASRFSNACPLPNEASGHSPARLALNGSSLLITRAQWARLFPERTF